MTNVSAGGSIETVCTSGGGKSHFITVILLYSAPPAAIVPSCEVDNRAATPFGHCASTAFLRLATLRECQTKQMPRRS